MTETHLSLTPVVLTQQKGHLGRIILNRPRQLNAVDYEMACGIGRVLDAWEQDLSVRVIVLQGGEARAFCAGGDLKVIYAHIARGETAEIYQKMLATYAVMRRIAAFSRPVVSLMDGIAMGGGIGLGGHAAYRVVTERSVLAMPETGIGLTPDAGGSWILSRAPGFFGLRLAVTGGVMTPQQAVTSGFADYLMQSDTLPALVSELEHRMPEDVFAAVPHVVPARASELDACFDAPDLPSALEKLACISGEEAQKDRDLIARACPFSLCLSWEAWHRARTLPALADAFSQEECLVGHLLRRHDFSEGVRSRLIDRDNAPRWSPSVLDAVNDEEIMQCFEALHE
ncbi:3-hydroxyisobutyryl-CoA hydrolase [Acetobacter sp. DmW_043]|uniref:enoyl-CoA hydratase/isomerase family protein n=1 Tax=Acetobacter sp. DmW_043 TaxID=1670658 RepID=UPI000A36D4E1|nr:enoyl-CoA hydratase/isomerase family protein [Acetobacter sp. DmW_043]OUI87578.1 3-hydroxyisobutyryl-CoA hydrolase [Acetobacter sp. DmW_043]